MPKSLLPLALIALAFPGAAQTVSDPASAGMSKERLERIRPALERLIAANHIPGGVTLVARRGRIVYFDVVGLADRESKTPLQKDSIFRIYSMSKAVTAVAVMTLYEEGRFALTDPVSKYLPEFANMKVAVPKAGATGDKAPAYAIPVTHPITIRDLLRHTSGLSYNGPNDEKGEKVFTKLGINGANREEINLAEVVKRIAAAPLMDDPGTKYRYGVSIDVLGRLVEVVSGKPLDEYLAERIFNPLHMTDTAFYVPEAKWKRLATLYETDDDGILRLSKGIQQEGYKTKPTSFMGGAGLASTTMDYYRFVQMLLNGGELDKARILSPKTVELMSTDHLGDIPHPDLSPGYGMGLTFAVNLGPGKTGHIGSEGEYNWGGAAGTAFWIDPKEKLAGVFMQQTFADKQNTGRLIKQLVYQSIVD